MMAPEEKLEDHKSCHNSSWSDYECLNQISWQSIQKLPRHFTQNLHVNLTVALKEKSVDAKVGRIHPLSTMNVDTDYANSHWSLSP